MYMYIYGDDDDRCIQGRGNGFISELGSHSVALADAHHQGLAMWVNMVMMMMVVAVTVVMMMVTVVMVVMMVPEIINVVVKQIGLQRLVGLGETGEVKYVAGLVKAE